MIKKLILSVVFLSNVLPVTQAQEIRNEDKIRIAEAENIANKYGDEVWKDWSKVPFTLLLVTDKYEFLINHPNHSDDFKKLGYDSLMKSEVYYRDRVFNTKLLATFPAINNVNVIVVGEPENTGRSSLGWIFTILHEHFHQYQYTQPDYYDAVNSLDLAGNDNTGMWMLNYGFPYDKEEVVKQYSIMMSALKDAIGFYGTKESEMMMAEYMHERDNFKKLLNEKDYAYFSFQNWQEGIADYTEMKLMELLQKDNYEFSSGVKTLSDYVSLDSFAVKYYNNKMNLAQYEKLSEDKRVCFYTSGSLEGILLDKVNTNWHDLYFAKKFYMEEYYK
jgi:hypothetical protein